MPGQPFDRIAVLYNYLFHNTSKGHTVAVADILTNYRNHGYELEIKSFYRDKDVLNALDGIEIAYDHKTRGYWMKTDGFEPYELRLIVDSLQIHHTERRQQDYSKGLEPDRPQYQRRSEPPVVRRRPYPQYE